MNHGKHTTKSSNRTQNSQKKQIYGIIKERIIHSKQIETRRKNYRKSEMLQNGKKRNKATRSGGSNSFVNS